MAVVEYAKCGDQSRAETVVGGGTVGGVLGAPADRGIGQGADHARHPDEAQDPPALPLALVQRPGHSQFSQAPRCLVLAVLPVAAATAAGSGCAIAASLAVIAVAGV